MPAVSSASRFADPHPDLLGNGRSSHGLRSAPIGGITVAPVVGQRHSEAGPPGA